MLMMTDINVACAQNLNPSVLADPFLATYQRLLVGVGATRRSITGDKVDI